MNLSPMASPRTCVPAASCIRFASSKALAVVRRAGHVKPLRVLADPPTRQDTASEGSVPWFKKNAHLWVEVKTRDELNDTLRAYPEKLAVVEFYAGWCSSCRTAFPNMCKLAGDSKLQETLVFVKANIEEEDIRDMVKERGITGIPYVAVIDSTGALVAGLSGSFKKMDKVRSGLALVAQHPAGRFGLDPSGSLQLLDDTRNPASRKSEC